MHSSRGLRPLTYGGTSTPHKASLPKKYNRLLMEGTRVAIIFLSQEGLYFKQH